MSWIRQARVELVSSNRLSPSMAEQATATIDGLRMTFTIKLTGSAKSNDATVTVSNLSEERRAQIQRRPLHVRLFAGYEDTGLALLFAGDARHTSSVREGATWQTTIELGSAERAITDARLSRSYQAGVRRGQVVKDLCATMGLAPPSIPDGWDRKLSGGLSVYGPAAEQLRKLFAPDYTLSIGNGRVELVETGQRPVRQFAEGTGLIGVPQPTYNDSKTVIAGIQFECTLAPEITPGSLVSVVYSGKAGQYRVKTVSHTGDTHGGDWKTQVEADIKK